MDARRLRLLTLAAGLIGAGGLLGAWTQPWYDAVVADLGLVPVTGQEAAPALSSLAFVMLAAVGVALFTGGILRSVVGGLQAAAGAVAVIVIAGAVLRSDLHPGGWALAAIAAAVVGTAGGLATAIWGRRWPAPTKYDTAARRSDSAAGTWDALSDGDDPTTR